MFNKVIKVMKLDLKFIIKCSYSNIEINHDATDCKVDKLAKPGYGIYF